MQTRAHHSRAESRSTQCYKVAVGEKEAQAAGNRTMDVLEVKECISGRVERLKVSGMPDED